MEFSEAHESHRIPNNEAIAKVKVRGSMSSILGLYNLVRHIVETTPEFNVPELDLERASLLKWCSVVDCFLAAKRRQVSLRTAAAYVREAYVREANAQHLQALVAAHCRRAVKPKLAVRSRRCNGEG